MTRILVATADGLYSLPGNSQADLTGHDVAALARDSEGWWAVADERVLLHGTPGAEWSESARGDARLTCLLVASDGLFAGTAGARLIRLVDGRLEPVAAFDEAPGRDAWYTPWGGPPAVRSLSAHPDGTLYVNVHVGGILRSHDGGGSWEPTIDIDLDVHEVQAEARSGRVVAATGAGGFALSEARGDSWRLSAGGLHGRYCRAVAVASSTVLLSASTGPRTRQGALYRRLLGDDEPFERCRRGLPEWFEGNIDTGWLDAAGDSAAFATPAGELYISQDAGQTWQRMAEGLPPVRAVALDES
ncbi:MAG: WD40/YVTN/BNR-like repeat-containing protein [Nitriliruptorales bacterium]